MSTMFYAECLERLKTAWSGLPDKPEEEPESTLATLWWYSFAGETYSPEIREAQLPELTDHQVETLIHLLDERMNGTPLAYITGFQFFMGYPFYASRSAMIPRRETEILVRAALDLLEHNQPREILDVCTGSGNIILTIANQNHNCSGFGSDLSPDAIELAQRNAARLALDHRIQFVSGDLFAPFDSDMYYHRFDLITCNPPYISSAQVEKMPREISDFEPRLAFDGGPFGVKILTRFIREAPNYLKPSAWMCFEVGAGQGQAIQKILAKVPGIQELKTFCDHRDEIRALAAQLK